MSGTVRVEREGPIATVILDNPGRLNAVSTEMWRELGTAFENLNADLSLRCIVLRGAGDAFAAGADISGFETERNDPQSAKIYDDLSHHSLAAISGSPHPVVALIKGACVGGGLEIAAQCDLRICGESSRFGIPVKRLGLVVAYREMQGLLSVVSPAVALEILLEGRVFGAAEADKKGLVTRVVPDDQVETEAYKSAGLIAEGAPLVARWHKKFVRRLLDPTPLSETELDESYACFGTEDFRIGFRAFLAKTKPEFQGR
ncbi:MAG TPA: enoyl-CoA hydratase-related protein [Aliidongia sp.]|nr:enoyl-CoA hydratase-related protein [Aliidongia sp.]